MTRATARKRGRNVLVVVAGLLLASALVRLGAGPGMAIASDVVTGLATTADQSAPPRPQDADITPDLLALLSDVRAREERLATREAEFEARRQVLALVEKEVKNDIARLEAAESELRATISVASQAAESDIARLTAVYENMKSEQAATLFEKMEPSFAAGFLARMRPDAAAAILSGLEPELAYSISVVLAGRNADVPIAPRTE